MLSSADFLAKFRFDTAENEPAQNLQKKKMLILLGVALGSIYFSHFGSTPFSSRGCPN